MTAEPSRVEGAWALPWLFLVLLLTMAFGRWSVGSPWAFPAFVLACFATLYAPGSLCLALLGLRVDAFEELALATLLGTIGSGIAFWLSAFAGTPRLFWIWPAAAATAWVLRLGRRNRPPGLSAGTHALVVGLVVAVIAPFFVLPLYYRNLSPVPGGLTFYALPDLVLHASISNELLREVPPQVPFLPGLPLAYHYGMDLVVAMLHRAVPNLDVADLLVRFAPTLFMALAALSIFCFGREWLGSRVGAGLATLLVVLGEDFSFVPGLLHGAPIPWCIHFFGVPTVVSLYLLNPMLPALAFLFGGLLALTRFERAGERRWLLVGSALLAASAVFKVFCAGQALVAVGLAGLLGWARRRDARFLKAAAATAFAMAPLLLPTWGGAAKASVSLTPSPYVPTAMFRMGLWDTPLASFALAVPLYLLGSLGLRAIAVPSAIRGLWRGGEPMRTVLVLFVLMGPLLTLTCAVTPAGYPPGDQYNNAVWFFVQSKYVAWFLVVELLLRIGAAGFARLGLVVVLSILLSFPSAAQFLAYQASDIPAPTLDATELDLLRFLRDSARPGDVVLANGGIGRAIVTLTPCRAILLDVFPHYFVARSDLGERVAQVDALWSALRGGSLRGDLLRAAGAELLLVDRRETPSVGRVPEDLEAVYGNDRFALFRARPR